MLEDRWLCKIFQVIHLEYTDERAFTAMHLPLNLVNNLCSSNIVSILTIHFVVACTVSEGM